MKKIIICLLIVILGIMQISCGVAARIESEKGAEDQIMVTAPSYSVVDEEPPQIGALSAPIIQKKVAKPKAVKAQLLVAEENYILQEDFEIVDEKAEETRFYEVIPLTSEEQVFLLNACTEFNVPFALSLALIETETNFRNISGDNGNSSGYMQIQIRFHRDRMSRLGVTDLMDPEGNFRVGLDLLSELYNQYGDWGKALTVYNNGSYPGYLTNYAYVVLERYANWQELVGNYV